MADIIEIVAYDPTWPHRAQAEMINLQQILGKEDIVAIEHVGSTAVPNLPAKPIIDIQIAVKDLTAVKEDFIKNLASANYQFWYENPDDTRLFFVKGFPPLGSGRTHHLHIVASDSQHWHQKLFFRNYLRQHPDTAKEYAHLKQELASQYQSDREKYTEAKSVFIQAICQLDLTIKSDSVD